MNWLIFFIVGALLLYGLSRLTMFLELEYQRTAKDDNLVIKLYVLNGLVFYQLKVPIMEVVYDKNMIWLESELTAEKSAKTHTKEEMRTFKRLVVIYLKHPRKLKRLIRLVNHLMRIYIQTMDKMISSLHCEKFYLKTQLGFKDAELTGLSIGYLWFLKNLMLVKLRHTFCFKKPPVVEIVPHFNQAMIAVKFHCIFSIRVGNVINASLYFISHKEAVNGG